MPYPDNDEARKKAQRNPLTEYFGEQAMPVQAPAPAPAPAPQQAPAPAPATNVGTGAMQRAPVPTSFTNFSRVQSANRDVSNREAGAYGQRATANADKARTSLDALRARFGGQVAAGTVGAAQMGFDKPTDTDGGSGLMGESTNATLGGGLTSAEMLANAGKSYSGPMGLAELKGSDDTYAATLAAQQNLDALGNEGGMQALVQQQNQMGNAGSSKLSGALIGSAGRKDFDALRARFHPEQDVGKAEEAAAAEAKAAGETSATNAKQWGELAGTTKTQEDAEVVRLAAEAKRKTGNAAAIAAAEKAKNGLPSYETALHKYGVAPYLGPTKTWADYAPDLKPYMVKAWVDGFKADALGGTQTSYGKLTTPGATQSTGLTEQRINAALESMDSNEFVRFLGLDAAQQGEYLKIKAAVGGGRTEQ